MSPSLDRTVAALGVAGLDLRRVREEPTPAGAPRQAFFRLGEVILEVVAHPNVETGPARFWGITFAVADLDAAAELLGDRLGTIRGAVRRADRRRAHVAGG